MAHFSGDEAFVTAFTEGIDVHRQTASVIFDVPVGEVTAGQRGQAKTVNFATLYGQGPFSLARQLGISREQAKDFIATYFERFRGVRDFLDAQVEMARETGYVETLMGRRRYVPELRAGKNKASQTTPAPRFFRLDIAFEPNVARGSFAIDSTAASCGADFTLARVSS